MGSYCSVLSFSGSFSKAATREGVPVSTVSRKIAELEAALGVRLLERSTRQLRMSEIGQDYFELFRRGLTEFEAADALMTDRRTEISGRLRISIPPSMSDLPEWRFATVTMAAAYPSNRYLSPLVRAFKDFCVTYFERRPLA